MKRNRWVAVGTTLILAGAVALGGCRDGDASSPGQLKPTDATDVPRRDKSAAISVVESVRPGQSEGFDPAAWLAAVDQAAVLPPGSRLQVVEKSFTGNSRSATVDAVLTGRGAGKERLWVFLRKVDGRWVIYGTLPLGGPSR